MADRTVRAIFEASVSTARKNISGLGKDTADAGKKVDTLTKDLKALDAQKVKPKIDVAIEAAQRNIKDITLKLGELRTLEVTPEVTADIRAAEKQLAEARKSLRQLNSAKAEMRVEADTSPAKREISSLAEDVAAEGADAGDEAGQNIATGIIDALRTIPIAGAIIGVGVAIAGGLLLGVKQGLAIEAERDLFSAQTGLDEDTAARFGRAAGEAYANAWGDSVAANLDTARLALQAGIIDSDATDAEIENVIAKLTGLSTLFDQDIAMSIRGVGNLMKTGLVRDADEAFDLITVASQKAVSDDLLETINEYSNQFVTLGLTGRDSFGLIIQGAQAGARDTDKIADTLKEMGLRIREGTKPALVALKQLGLDADGIVKAFQEGGPNARRAIDQVFDALRRLEAKGGNTQAVIAALFGGAGEDLGAALYALDIDNVADALGGVEGAAGAADRALKTMTDNTSTKIEEARRNVEVAMDGIKGALAEAFGDDIGNAAEWVAKNRGPVLQFFLDIINGALDAGEAFVEFGASSLDTIAAIADGIAGMPEWLVGSELKKSAQDIADASREAATNIRRDVPAALDDVRNRVNEWAGPEIMKARVHDATVAMTQDMDKFSAVVDKSGGTIEINGVKLNAEQALKELTEKIDATDGTVTINGDAVPAEDALDVLMALINAGAGEVEVGAETSDADAELARLKARVPDSGGSIHVDADTDAAERALANLTKKRYITLGIRVAGVNAPGGLTAGTHAGGFTGRLPGRYVGGWVPGRDPGYDNVLWPLNSGGRTLAQPLAGGEYVVNSKDAAVWGPLLEFINGGGRPTSHSVTNDSRLLADVVNITTQDARSFQREMRTTTYRTKARPGRG